MNPTFAQFRLFPESASSIADRVDNLYLFLVAVATFFTVLICVLILTFATRYRSRRGHVHGPPPNAADVDAGLPDGRVSDAEASQLTNVREQSHKKSHYLLEIGWAVVPLLLTMVMFAWGAEVYYDIRRPPADTLDIDIVGKQWMWKAWHAEGPSEINSLHVPVGQPVRLRMISDDVIHSFYVPAFRVKQDVLPGRYTELWFEASKTGTFHLFCAEYCGTEHSRMIGDVVVMEPDKFSDWLAGETGEPPAVVGERLFQRHGCAGCHGPPARSGPSLQGLFGRTVALEGGRTVKADEQYIRQSVLDPQSQVVAGWKPQMPSFEGQLTETQIMQITAYLRSLSEN